MDSRISGPTGREGFQALEIVSQIGQHSTTMKYRIQFENSLGPDSQVFDTEQAAFDSAMSQWPEGGWWIIPEE
jgi:hypothetical protein